jgi:hypothetical protein
MKQVSCVSCSYINSVANFASAMFLCTYHHDTPLDDCSRCIPSYVHMNNLEASCSFCVSAASSILAFPDTIAHELLTQRWLVEPKQTAVRISRSLRHAMLSEESDVPPLLLHGCKGNLLTATCAYS